MSKKGTPKQNAVESYLVTTAVPNRLAVKELYEPALTLVWKRHAKDKEYPNGYLRYGWSLKSPKDEWRPTIGFVNAVERYRKDYLVSVSTPGETSQDIIEKIVNRIILNLGLASFRSDSWKMDFLDQRKMASYGLVEYLPCGCYKGYCKGHAQPAKKDELLEALKKQIEDNSKMMAELKVELGKMWNSVVEAERDLARLERAKAASSCRTCDFGKRVDDHCGDCEPTEFSIDSKY